MNGGRGWERGGGGLFSLAPFSVLKHFVWKIIAVNRQIDFQESALD